MILKIKKEQDKPQEGDIKIEVKFAWWPTWVQNKRIWLQKYKVAYMYKIRDRFLYFPHMGYYKFPLIPDWDEIGTFLPEEKWK